MIVFRLDSSAHAILEPIATPILHIPPSYLISPLSLLARRSMFVFAQLNTPQAVSMQAWPPRPRPSQWHLANEPTFVSSSCSVHHRLVRERPAGNLSSANPEARSRHPCPALGGSQTRQHIEASPSVLQDLSARPSTISACLIRSMSSKFRVHGTSSAGRAQYTLGRITTFPHLRAIARPARARLLSGVSGAPSS
ncbi:hypothetical protein BD414DRAFT_502262 [Trametes punicea]|nr:hypothetical protein BD414DRAFT_502262 [Trametes punicea]